jgi:streptogramin lyase
MSHLVSHEGNTMNRRHHARSNAAFISRSERRSSAPRARSKQPSLDRLESRCLLAGVAEFSVPGGTVTAPDGIAVGPGNSIWFTEFGADKIGTINPGTDAISEIPVPTPNAEPFRIALGPDGNLWFTEYGAGQIGMINPTTDKITEYPLSSAGGLPFGITAGPNHTVWFTESAGNEIGSIETQTGKVSEYPIPTMGSVPEGITLGSDGNIWFTENQGNQIGMFNPTTQTFVEHPLPTLAAQPDGITTGPGGNLYFTEYTGNQVGVFSVSGSSFLPSISVPTSNTEPTEITFAPNGNLWFTQSKTNQVAMLDPATGAITEVTPLSAESGPRAITASSDGSIWFAEVNSGKVAAIVPTFQVVSTSLPPLDIKFGQTFGLTVAIESGGDVDTGYDGSVSLALASASAGGSLVGTTTVTAVNGIATFTGLSLNHPGRFSIEVRSGTATPAILGPINVTGPTGSSPVAPPGNAPTGPVVLSEQLVIAGKGKNRYVAGVVLTFSSALDPVTAGKSSNYTVSQVTKAGRVKAVKPIRLRAAYMAARDAVKLTFTGKPRFTAGGELLLTASGQTGIASAAGVPLEGNMGNEPGANAIYTILPDGRGIAG